jgi:hypothetical protein
MREDGVTFGELDQEEKEKRWKATS